MDKSKGGRGGRGGHREGHGEHAAKPEATE